MKKFVSLLTAFTFLVGGTQLMAQSSSHHCPGKQGMAKECSHSKEGHKGKKECCKKDRESCDSHESDEKSESVEFSTITKQELMDLMEIGGFHLVDARGPDSFAKGHIATAIQVGEFDVPEDKNTHIVAYCGGPKCAAAPKFARRLIEDGYTNVVVFTGGWLEWNSSEEDQASL